MLNKIKIIISAVMFCGLPLAAQLNTSSPYSRFGLGELNQPGFAHNLAMGGTGIGIRSGTLINFINPASYTEMDTMSFIFDFGLNGSQTTYADTSQESKMTNFNIHHIAIGFGITRNWKASLGIVPYSSVGYNIVENEFKRGLEMLEYNYKGSGGLNRFYIGNSFRFLKHFSAGFNLTYLFGYLNYANSVDFPYNTYAASTLIENRLNIGDITYNLGFQYNQTFSDKYFITLGAVFDNEAKLRTTQKIVQTSFFPGSLTTIGDSITIDPDFIVDSRVSSVETILPRNMGVGISLGIKNKLMLSGDYTSQEWSKSFIPGKTDTLVNSNSINAGIEYTPNEQALRGYLNRVHYRLGGYYSNNYLRIRGKQINDSGISFGVGLPLKKTRSSFNLGFIIGQRGTLSKNLIKENYGIFNFGLTFHDFWFLKRKFD